MAVWLFKALLRSAMDVLVCQRVKWCDYYISFPELTKIDIIFYFVTFRDNLKNLAGRFYNRRVALDCLL